MVKPRIVIVGAGFAGFHAAKRLGAVIDRAETVLINPTDYFLYLPLLPEVAAGALEPRRVCVSLPRQLPHVRLQLGTVDHVDVDERSVSWVGSDGQRSSMTYDRLLLSVGSVNRLLPIPGVAQNAHGFRNVSEALYLRDQITRQIEVAATTADRDERAARCTFVVVGAGYTGTEVAAQGQLFTARLARREPALRDQPVRWLLLDKAERLLPELDPRLSGTAERVLRRRGVEVRTAQSIRSAGEDAVVLDNGEVVPTHSLIWCVGVRPDPLVGRLSLPVHGGRLDVDATLQVPGHRDVFACGDCAAVPDLTRPGQVTPMTAQHAQRQGARAAQNIIASLGGASPDVYRHHDLGFLVDLGGHQAAANPLGVPLSGWAAKAVTRGYHLLALPGNRIRTAVDWTLNTAMSPPDVQLGMVTADRVRLNTESVE